LARLSNRRNELALYSLLLVLPTFVLGWLQWSQLRRDQQGELAQAPAIAEAAGQRFQASVQARLNRLLEEENKRHFYEYQERVLPEGLIGPELNFRPSEMAMGPRPEGILGWFGYEFRSRQDAPLDHVLLHGEGEGWEDWPEREAGLSATVEDLILRDRLDGFYKRISRYGQLEAPFRAELGLVVVNLSHEPDFECLRRDAPALAEFEDDFVDIFEYDFHVRYLVEEDGTERILATRSVLVPGDRRLARLPACYSNLARGMNLVQGFFIDPEWLFGDLLEDPGVALPGGATLLCRGPDGETMFAGMVAGVATVDAGPAEGRYYVFAGVDRVRELLAVPHRFPVDMAPKYRNDGISVMKPVVEQPPATSGAAAAAPGSEPQQGEPGGGGGN